MNRHLPLPQSQAVVKAGVYTPVTTHRLLWAAFILAAVALAGFMLAAPAHAATIPVETTTTTLVDDNACSLPEAIVNANDDAFTHDDCAAGNGADVIVLSAQTYTLTIPTDAFDLNNGLPAIISTLTISGNGATIRRVSDSEFFRIFYVGDNGNLTLNDVTVRDGFLFDEAGGGIFNSGVLTLNRSIVEQNATSEGFSGEGAGGDGADGGGIYNAGILTLNASIIRNNQTGKGGDGVNGDLYGGSGGNGGGVFNDGELVVSSSTIISNSTGSGGDGATGIESEGGFGGFGGSGGGIYSSGPLTVTDSTFYANRTGHGGDGGMGADSYGGGFGGFGGDGGGIFSQSSTTILRTLLIANSTGRGGQGGPPGEGGETTGFDGAQGMGGGLAYFESSRLDPALLVVVNSLFARNHPADGEGIAMGASESIPQIIHTTFANPALSTGSAIRVLCGKASVRNSIFANFTTGIENCDSGEVTSDYDLYFDNITDTIEVTVTNKLVGDPAFLNPGNDDYHLTATSAAIDVGANAGVTEDFEGEARPQWLGFDVGFDEFAVATITFSKQVVGGEAAPADWRFDIVGGAQDITHTGQVFLPSGVYIVTEDSGPTHNANYALTDAGSACSLVGDSVQLTVGSVDATCLITNTRRTATVTVQKVVVNDNGGLAGPDGFGLSLGGAPATSGVSVTVLANVPITISEAGLPGYTFVGITGAGCPMTLGGDITPAPGANIVCTIVNDDIAPTVTLHKLITNDDTANPNAFGLQINGTAVNSGQTLAVTANVPVVINELGLPGYAFVAITGAGCPSALGGAVTLAPGEALVCTISNQRTGVVIHRLDNAPLVEGDSDVVSYTVNLIGLPTAPVTVNLQPDAQVLVGPATLVFTPGNATSPQVVQILAVDDALVEGNHTGVISHSASSLDPHYNSPDLPFYNDGAIANNDPSTVLVDIIDNDTASILFRKTVSIDGYPPACSEQSTIKVPINTSIVYCYTIRNTGNTTFTVHTLTDDHLGTLLIDEEILLAPNASISRTFTATIAVTTTNIATWTASSLQFQDVSIAGQTPATPLVDAHTQATVFVSGPTDDQDGDGIPDNEEGAGDRNRNGIPDFLDPDEPTSLDEEKEPTGGASQRIFLPLVSQ